MAAATPPVNAPLLIGDTRQIEPVWLAFFQALSKQAAEIETLKARLAAAGIP